MPPPSGAGEPREMQALRNVSCLSADNKGVTSHNIILLLRVIKKFVRYVVLNVINLFDFKFVV
jgi:hypothetical protein